MTPMKFAETAARLKTPLEMGHDPDALNQHEQALQELIVEARKVVEALPPAGDVGEPVAWRARIAGSPRWILEKEKPTKLPELEVEPLYSADALERLSARLAEAERERDEARNAGIAIGQSQGARLHLELQDKLDAATARAERLQAALLSVQRMFRLDLYKQVEDGPHYNQALKDVSNRVNAALDSPAPQGDGWVLVPREPTGAMMQAALVELSDVTVKQPKAAAWDALRAYRVMIAATPNKGARDE